MPLSDRLRRETRNEHRRIERLPLPRALLAGSLPLEAFVALIESFYVLHEALEGELAETTEPRVRAVWTEERRKLPLLRTDLDELRKRARSPRLSLEALVLADEIRSRAAEAPVSLLGLLYVLEGATLGAAVLRPAVASAFGLQTAGLTYLSSYGSRVHEKWLEFKERLDRAPLDDEERETVVDAARSGFERIGLILRELDPSRAVEPLRSRARTLNPHAGSHPVAANPRELRAALLAGAATWKHFPYLHSRFGERGRAFTRSDTAWIVSLLESSETTLQDQLDWLAGLLSPRGMPRWILEVHLELLEAALGRELPERRKRYRPLARARDRFARRRRALLPEARFQELSTWFEQAAGPEETGRLPGTGAVLISAVIDEHDLTPRAVESLAWLVSPERFSARWIDAVEQTIEAARSELGGKANPERGRRRR